jgi:hypothetical protein
MISVSIKHALTKSSLFREFRACGTGAERSDCSNCRRSGRRRRAAFRHARNRRLGPTPGGCLYPAWAADAHHIRCGRYCAKNCTRRDASAKRRAIAKSWMTERTAEAPSARSIIDNCRHHKTWHLPDIAYVRCSRLLCSVPADSSRLPCTDASTSAFNLGRSVSSHAKSQSCNF